MVIVTSICFFQSIRKLTNPHSYLLQIGDKKKHRYLRMAPKQHIDPSEYILVMHGWVAGQCLTPVFRENVTGVGFPIITLRLNIILSASHHDLPLQVCIA